MGNDIPLPEEAYELCTELSKAKSAYEKAKFNLENATDVLAKKMKDIGVTLIKHENCIYRFKEARIPKDKVTVKLN